MNSTGWRPNYKPAPRLIARAIKEAVDPVSFYTSEIPSMPAPKRRAGWIDGGLCPFHTDSHTGNFRIHAAAGSFYCFACEARGPDIIAFTMARDGLSFREAVETLAASWGVR